MPDLDADKDKLIVELANLLAAARTMKVITGNGEWQQDVDGALERAHKMFPGLSGKQP